MDRKPKHGGSRKFKREMDTLINDDHTQLLDDENQENSKANISESNQSSNVHSDDRVSLTGEVPNFFCHPRRYMRMQFRAGSIGASMFNVIQATIGVGQISLPFLWTQNGIIMTAILICFGAYVWYFWGMLVISWAEKVGSSRYEDFAQHSYGRAFAFFTGICMMATLLSFVISYIVFVKTIIPDLIEQTLGESYVVPGIFGSGKYEGQIFWATIYTFLILFPLSITRKINFLRYSSLVGTFCSIYFAWWLVLIFLFDAKTVPDIDYNLRQAIYLEFDFQKIVQAVPFAIFGFMYQGDIPISYRELNDRTYHTMDKVVSRSTLIVIFLYFIVSIFGYLTVVGNEENLSVLIEKENLFEVNYDNWFFKSSIFLLLFTVFAAAPIWVLPPKDTFEALFFSSYGMTIKQNLIVTFGMCFACYICAIIIPGIGDVITILGCTTSPLVGFVLPVIFYLKLIEDVSIWKKLTWISIVVLMVVISFMGLMDYLQSKF